jgi:acyl carrier protein
MNQSTTNIQVIKILTTSLNLGSRSTELTLDSPLLGAIPELDSMAVVGIITTLEEQFGFTVYDDEISAENFETVQTLVDFVERKLDE